MDRERAEKMIRSGASSPGDVAIALLWLRHLTKGARGEDLARAVEHDALAVSKIGLPKTSDRRKMRTAEHVKSIFEARVLREMERLRAVIRSDHPYVTVKEQHPTHWEAAMRLVHAGEAETWALAFKKDRTGRGEGRRWWTITRSEDEEDERI